MQSSLAVTAVLMGLVGGPHCVAMCGAACAGLAQAAGPRQRHALIAFQIGRLVGYSVLGAVAAGGMQALGWLSLQSAALRPVWSMLHVTVMLVGVWLMLQARQPVWLDQSARRLWQRVRQSHDRRTRSAPWIIGALWIFMPCGLLYSALLVAALSGGPLEGALSMALFAAGSSLGLIAGPGLLARIREAGNRFRQDWGTRVAGGLLAATALFALWMDLADRIALWCA